MKSANFYGWLRSRQAEANAKLRTLYVEGICKAVSNRAPIPVAGSHVMSMLTIPVQDVLFWMRDKTEVEIVDFLIKMKSLLVLMLLCCSCCYLCFTRHAFGIELSNT